MSKKLFCVVSLLIVLSMLLASCQTTVTQVVTQVVKETSVVQQTSVVKETQIVQVTAPPQATATPAPSARKGAWVDQIVFTSIDQASAAVTQLQANDIDVYAYTVSDATVFQTVKGDSNLSYTTALGSYDEFTFNPSGPTFKDGRLNPFSDAKIREAMNWLVDRNYMSQEIFGGLAVPKYTTLNSAFPDYVKYIATVRALEVKYAYNPDKAKEVVTAEMGTLGATAGSDGKWQFNGAPVTIIAIIRTEDARRQLGDYFSNQLETLGFTVDRQYKTRSEASPIWNQSDPAEGQWHFYTGGWITTAISRDDATNFGYFYTPLQGGGPLPLAEKNTPEFLDVSTKLWNNAFSSMDERATLFEQALVLAMEDSSRVWLIDQISFAPQRKNVQVAYDLAGGVAGAQTYPYTIRFAGQEGGTMRVAQPGILVEPWNPVSGTNWVYDSMPETATTDYGVISDPYTGLSLPQRIEKADVVVKTGLPVAKTLDWVTLNFQDSIEVPADAWADWDAKTQTWIKVSDKYTSTVTANSKVTVTYPADLFTTVKFHDGSFITVGDFVMGMIMGFDLAKPDSANYDEAMAPIFDAFMSQFKAVQIESTDPLVISTYRDFIGLDAENMVMTWFPTANQPAFPGYGRASAPWTTLAVGNLADASTDPTTELAWSTDKASAKSTGGATVEWMNFVAGPSLDILKGWLDKAVAENYIPYAPTLGQYITADEATLRWKNLANWYATQGHFWVGAGPFYLSKAFPVEKTMTLIRFPDYPDSASKWSGFGVPMIPVVTVDGPGQVTIGQEATYDVFVTFQDQPYPLDKIDAVKFLVFDAGGNVITQGDATEVEAGHYTVTISAADSAKLVAGSNKLEVVTTSLAVSIPAITDTEFVAK